MSLVMKIGTLVVADWSHNGRCIIWQGDDETAPSLYRSEYDSGSLAPMNAPQGGLEKSHHGSINLNWQRAISEFIRQQTGLRVDERRYRVR